MRRINEVLREVIGAAISTELSDPRIGFVTVTSVETSPDLRAAKVHVSVLGDEEQREAPTLTFHYDPTVETGMRISKLLEEDR
jgi:ribosome-binding factor A